MAKNATAKKTPSRGKGKGSKAAAEEGNTRKRAQAKSAPKDGPTYAHRAMTKSHFDDSMRRYEEAQAVAKNKGMKVAEIVDEAVEHRKCHSKTFKLVATLKKMNPIKLREWLDNFDLYRDHAALDKLAAADMFKDGAGSTEKNVRRRNVGKDAAAEQGGGEDDDESVKDTEVGPEMAGRKDFGGESPFRSIAEAGDEVIAETERRLN